MPREVVGHRIGALLGADHDQRIIRLLGFGQYDGDCIPPTPVWLWSIGLPNPKLTLDNGSVAWGCECWWGPEDQIMKFLLSYARSGWVIEQCSRDWRGMGNVS